jgi:hypothetical protein
MAGADLTCSHEVDELTYMSPTCACCCHQSQEEDPVGALVGSAALIGGIIAVKKVAPPAKRLWDSHAFPALRSTWRTITRS